MYYVLFCRQKSNMMDLNAALTLAVVLDVRMIYGKEQKRFKH